MHCARNARYFQTMFPLKSPWARPWETPLELGDPNCTGGDLEGDLPGSCGMVKDQGPWGGGKLTVCWAAEMEGKQVASLNLGWQRRWTPSCIADSPLSTHLGSIASGGVRLQPSQPPWQEVAGHWKNTLSPILRSMEKMGLRNEEGSMMSCNRHPQSVSPYQSTEKKSRCGGNGQKMCAKKVEMGEAR